MNLNPTGSSSSQAFGTNGTQQVGVATIAGVERAALWSGTAASWVDLHALLPSNYNYSEARSVWSDGVNTYVAGIGVNTSTGNYEALLWTQPIPAPGTVALLGLGGLFAARRRR